MKRKTIEIGAKDFREVIEKNRYYVDKTLFIQEILEKGAKVTLITRPRRFGKTLNMSTLKYFFDIRDGESNRDLFKGMKIENTEWISEQGKYPVIHLTMKEIKGDTYEEFMRAFISKVSNLYEEHKYIREKLDKRNLKEFDKIWEKEDKGDYKEAIIMLSEMLYEYHGVKPVILIDEYDAPMMDAYDLGYFEKVQKLIGSFYGNALKDGCCSFAVVTGIMKIAKESIFSTLNNPKVSTILTGDYNHFGMTEKEVLEALEYFRLETTIGETREWYNGYLFGKEKVYNPWSITHHCEGGKLEAYWIGTSANLLIKEFLRDADEKINDSFYTLMKKERVKVKLNDYMLFGKKYGTSGIIYLMISAGYLTIDSRGEDRNEYYVTIPNREVMEYFEDTFIEIASSDEMDDFPLIKEALLEADMESLEKIIQEMFINSFSYMDLTREEKFYHTIVLSLIGGFKSRFYTHSNRESGLGRYDLALEPKDKNGTGYIFEFKIVPKEEYLKIEKATNSKNQKKQEKKLQDMIDKLGEEALTQIDRKLYDSEMRGRGISKIKKVGMVFCGKQVKLYSR